MSSETRPPPSNGAATLQQLPSAGRLLDKISGSILALVSRVEGLEEAVTRIERRFAGLDRTRLLNGAAEEPHVPISSAPRKRSRGRPPGSRNRPKIL
jgi:hypothetical protein